MWHLLLNLVVSSYLICVKSAWVEIPQLPSSIPNKRVSLQPQFVFGAPKVSFIDPKLTTTTPQSHRMLTTPKASTTTLAIYKNVMTSTTVTPLTTTPKIIEMPKRVDRIEAIPESKEDNSDYSGFLPLLHTIQETLVKNAKNTLKSKVSLLTNLRDTLLANIDERMSTLWHMDEDLPESRGHHDKEMDFPSNEGALLTIAFLTFAVFLIKLVLKLIQTLKNKQMSSAMMMTTMSPTAVAFIGRKKRDIDDLKILQLIEEYQFS